MAIMPIETPIAEPSVIYSVAESRWRIWQSDCVGLIRLKEVVDVSSILKTCPSRFEVMRMSGAVVEVLRSTGMLIVVLDKFSPRGWFDASMLPPSLQDNLVC